MLVREAFPAITTKHPGTSRFLAQFLFDIFQNANTIKKTTEIHTQIIINNFTQRNFIIVQLLQSYVSSGYILQAHKAFQQIKNPSTTSWNQIIRGYAGTETPREALHVFDEMLQSGEAADGHSYSYVISACARGKFFRLGEKFHGRVLAGGFSSNLFVQTNLVNLYSGDEDYGGLKNARKVFDEMRDRNLVTWNTLVAGYVKSYNINGARKLFDEMPERNIISYTTMISGYAQNGGCKEAISLLHKMIRARMELDQVTLTSALSACAEIGDLKTGRWIHSYIDRNWQIKNKNHTIRLNNALLHMYAGCGVINDAYELFKSMPLKSTVSWTTMISGFAKQGYGEKALNIFKQMEQTKDDTLKPDAITMLAILNACNHSGLVDQGRYIFKNMKNMWKIEPKIEHYGCMVDLLSRAGCLKEAYELIETMIMDPNDVIWGALLGGCKIHKNVNLATQIVKKIVNLNLEDEKIGGYLVLLSNVYAGAKRWKDVAIVRENIDRLGLKKAPGRSWVQTGESVHEFLASDVSHKHSSRIDEMLYLVMVEVGFNGYKHDVYDSTILSWSIGEV